MTQPFLGENLLCELARRGACTERTVAVRDEVGSTSTELAELLKRGAASGAVVVARRQTAGRGRQGRTWFSPGSGDLYLSLGVQADAKPDGLMPVVPLAAGVAAVDALVEAGATAARLKWPNDVMLDGRKLAGILCEVPHPVQRPGMLVVGIGVNVGARSFPGEIAGIATSLALVVGRTVPLEVLAAAWIAELEKWVDVVRRNGRSGLLAAWKERALPSGRRVRVGGIEGTTVDLDGNGRLVLRLDDGSLRSISGGIVEDATS
ncbi:MAG: biotin--[acetyl-CoA-carboxylase] ligase [Deltaproteobacteria bacterium]|nr:biotin--[acetyl-CoA-carboxylase] ligase [Deltaproteobacteria bacterium]